MIRKILILLGAALAIMYRSNGAEIIRYISLIISSACLGSIIQEIIDEKKKK